MYGIVSHQDDSVKPQRKVSSQSFLSVKSTQNADEKSCHKRASESSNVSDKTTKNSKKTTDEGHGEGEFSDEMEVDEFGKNECKCEREYKDFWRKG